MNAAINRKGMDSLKRSNIANNNLHYYIKAAELAATPCQNLAGLTAYY